MIIDELIFDRTADDVERVKVLKDQIMSEGLDSLTGLRLRSAADGTESLLPVDGAFLAIGTEPENGPFRTLAPLNEAGYIRADESCRTPTPGLFAAGDCRTKAYRQVATAVADGAVAALGAVQYLDKNP